MNEADTISALAALAQETRLRIVKYLVTKGPDGAAAGEISEVVDAAASRASFHLATLEDAGLILSERQSRSIVYRVDFDQIGALMKYLIEDCCQNNADVRACC